MEKSDKNSLVPRPRNAVEKAAPGAKRILSGMVGETLGLAKKTTSKGVSADTQLENWFQTGEKYYWGRGEPQDYAEACKWFRKAAERNHVEAQFSLGWCYRHEQGVPLDVNEAIKWFRKAADKNYADAKYQLGFCYDEDEECVKWFRMAAEQNHIEAQTRLADWYYTGYGVPQNYPEAINWYRKAAEQNDVHGLLSLGVCYEKGQGIQQDVVEAYKFYKLATKQNQNHEIAVEHLRQIVTKMTPVEIADGDSRVRKFRLSNPLD